MNRNILPIHGLNENIQKVITTYAKVYQCPQEYITAAVFQTTAAAVGDSIMIDSGKYKNMLALWVAVVGESGSNKSAPVKAVLKPLETIDKENYIYYKDALKSYKRALKEGQETDPPICKQIVTMDTTPEKRYKSLSEGNSLLLYSDELYTHFSGGDRYGSSAKNVRSQELSLWNGDGFRADRKGEEPLLIGNAFFSMFGGIQPEIVTEVFGHNHLIRAGYPQRWLWLYPEPTPPPHYTDEVIPLEISNYWDGFINNLYRAKISRVLRLSNEAKMFYSDAFNLMQDEIGEFRGRGDRLQAEFYAKLEINLLRLTGIAHLLGNDPLSNIIEQETIVYAWQLLGYFKHTTVKVCQLLTAPKRPLSEIGSEVLLKEVLRRVTDENREIIKSGKFELNQSEIARALGCSQQYINRLFADLRKEF